MSLRDVHGSQTIDAYLKMPRCLLPLGLKAGVTIDLYNIKMKLATMKDKFYFIDTIDTSIQTIDTLSKEHIHISNQLLQMYTLPTTYISNCFLNKDEYVLSTGLVRKFQINVVNIIYAKVDARGRNNGTQNQQQHSSQYQHLSQYQHSSQQRNQHRHSTTKTRTSCLWELSCLVDDGTGQATLQMEGDQVLDILQIKDTEMVQMEQRAKSTLSRPLLSSSMASSSSSSSSSSSLLRNCGGVLEFSSSRRDSVYDRSLKTSEGKVITTPEQHFGRCVDRSLLLRPLIIYGAIQPISRPTTTTIDLNPLSKVQTKALSKLIINGRRIEEVERRSETWMLLNEVE